jgi:hypothetical protein
VEQNRNVKLISDEFVLGDLVESSLRVGRLVQLKL